MIKIDMFVVSKGTTNPWVYHVASVDKLRGIALLQFAGHNGKARPSLDWTQRDKFKAIEELAPATVGQLQAAWGIPANNFNSLQAKATEMRAMLSGRPTRAKPSCNHEWNKYTGFRECYRFCSKCDEKIAIDD